MQCAPGSTRHKAPVWSLCLALLAGLTLAAGGARGGQEEDQDNPHHWQPRTTSVAVFKNGLGFFIREGEVDLRDGWCLAREVPPATFGTLAIYSANAEEAVDIVGSGPGEVVEFDDLDAPKDVAAKRARLEACRNLRVELTYSYKGSQRSAAGTLVSVGPEFAILDTDDNSFAVPIDDTTRLQVLDLPLRIHVAADSGQAPERTGLGMAYLRKGITWIPDYTLKVLDDDTAELALRGTLVNEAEDLIHCDVHLVVGVPHFAHTDYLAPIAVGQIIRTMGAALAPTQVTTQIMSRAAIASNAAVSPQFEGTRLVPAGGEGGDVSNLLRGLPQMGGAAATDYTVYTKEDLTLRRGEKAIVTLFTRKIKYSHLYRWNPPSGMDHFLVLHNTSDTAWTTGPCLAVSEKRPLTEDLLRYTPKGGDCELPVTTAVNIAHERSEREVDRKLKAHNPRHDYYLDLVTLEGELKVRNFEARVADIIITAAVPGQPTEASDGGVLFSDPEKLKLTERRGTVRWRIQLEPGASKTLTYAYERYVPSG